MQADLVAATDEKTANAKLRQAFDLLKPFKVNKTDDRNPWAANEFALQALTLERSIGVALGIYKDSPAPDLGLPKPAPPK